MRKFYQQVVKYPRLILTGFLAAFVLCFFCQKFIAVDYDMNDYLPKDSPSTIALETMGAEYTGGIPNARVMVRNVTVPEALSYKEKLCAVDGVTNVTVKSSDNKSQTIAVTVRTGAGNGGWM